MQSVFITLKQFLAKTDIVDWMLWIAVTAFCAYPLTDPDFGWHLRFGLDWLKTLTIPQFDTYAHTMSNWHWVNHEWLSDIIIAWIYQHLGAVALILFFAVMVVVAFLLAGSWSGNRNLKTKLLVAGGLIFANAGRWGVRPQVISILGGAIVLWCFSAYRQGKIKQLWWLIPIFWLWANLHGGFMIGLVILAVGFLAELIKYKFISRRVDEPSLTLFQLRHLALVGLLSGLVTLINPYGWQLYVDFYRLFVTPIATEFLNEWMSIFANLQVNHLFLWHLGILVGLMLFTYRKLEPTRWMLAGVLLLLTIWQNRHAPLFMLMSAGLFVDGLDIVGRTITGWFMRFRWLGIAIAGLGIWFILAKMTPFLAVVDDIQTTADWAGYPYQAVQWAKANPDKIGTKMFNVYGDGGFLVWQFPDQKVFVDGRMAYWQVGDKFAYRDYLDIAQAKPTAITMMQQRYGVDWVMVSPRLMLASALLDQPDWQLVYEDQLAVIFTKKSLLANR